MRGTSTSAAITRKLQLEAAFFLDEQVLQHRPQAMKAPSRFHLCVSQVELLLGECETPAATDC